MGFVMPHVLANDCQALLSFSLMALRHLCNEYYFVTDLLGLPGSSHLMLPKEEAHPSAEARVGKQR